jgi:hypothetical protein
MGLEWAALGALWHGKALLLKTEKQGWGRLPLHRVPKWSALETVHPQSTTMKVALVLQGGNTASRLPKRVFEIAEGRALALTAAVVAVRLPSTGCTFAVAAVLRTLHGGQRMGGVAVGGGGGCLE